MYQVAAFITLGILGVVAIGGILLLRDINSERAYYAPFDRDRDPGGADVGVLQNLLREAEQRIRLLRSIPPGRERSRLIRQLRADFHPDRHPHLPFLLATFNEVAGIINDRTQEMLAEDRRAEPL